MAEIVNLKAVDGEGVGPTPVRAVQRALEEHIDRGGVLAVAVVVVSEEDGDGHCYYAGRHVPRLSHAAAYLAHRLVVHGTVDPLPGEWDASTLPDGFDMSEEDAEVRDG